MVVKYCTLSNPPRGTQMLSLMRYTSLQSGGGIAILCDLSQCDVHVQNLAVSESTVSSKVLYYSSSKVYEDTTVTDRAEVFAGLFAGSGANIHFRINQTKASLGDHVDNMNAANSLLGHLGVTAIIWVLFVMTMMF